MFKVLVVISVVLAGVGATDSCDEPVDNLCITGTPPTKFPETKEDLSELCEFAVPYFECRIDHGEKCQLGERFQNENKKNLELSNDACDEDTLLHAAVVNNLKCFSELAKEDEVHNQCFTEMLATSPATLHQYAEKFQDDGLLELSDDERKLRNTYECIAMLRELACYAVEVDKKCGILAMVTYVQILHKIDPGCGRTPDFLPEVIRLYRLEKQEENVLTNILKRGGNPNILSYWIRYVIEF